MQYTTLITNIALLLLSGISAQKRVINGWNAKPYSLPYIVTASTEDNGHFCGGSLLDRKTVLTAAHCSSGKPEDIMVSVHRHNLTKSSDEEKGFTTVLSKMINHPKYDEQSLSNDIAVWILKSPIPEDVEVAFVKLADNEQDKDTDLPVLTAAGWGLSDYKKGVMPPILQKANLKAISRKECTEGWKNEPIDLSHSLCTLSVNKNQSICNGDSGGPLAYKQGDDYIQVGLVSFGEVECELKNKKPDGFIRVASYKSWIEKQQKNNKKSYLVGYASGFVKNIKNLAKNQSVKEEDQKDEQPSKNHLSLSKAKASEDKESHHLNTNLTDQTTLIKNKGLNNSNLTTDQPLSPKKIDRLNALLSNQIDIFGVFSKIAKKVSHLFTTNVKSEEDELSTAMKSKVSNDSKHPDPKIITKKEDSDFIKESLSFIDTQKDFSEPKKALRSLTNLFYQGIY